MTAAAAAASDKQEQEQEQLGSWFGGQQRLGVAMDMPGKVAMETADESTESVVLQCSSSGDVEDGEEVVRSEPRTERVMFVPTNILGPKRFALKMMASRGREWEEDVVVRSSGVRAWLTDDSAYWNTGGRVRTRRSKEMNGHVEDVGETDVVEKTHVKRKFEESKECDRLSESELDEGTDSDAESSSSSDSDASESEEEVSWNANKRRRAGEEACESVHLKSGRGRSINFDGELKEMQLLLELQLKASERREAGMKQRMETMMALMAKHVGHVEKRVSTLEDQPQEQILERINVKLEKVMEGFTTLNENLSILSACLSKDFDSQ